MKARCYAITGIVFFAAVMTCCKKKKETTPEPVSYTYTSSISLYQYYQVNNNQAVRTKRVPYVSISKKSSTSKGPEAVNISSIYLSNVKVNAGSDGYYYRTNGDTISQNMAPPFTWQVNGSSDYPTFTETISDTLPEFFKSNMLPDSVSRTGSTVIQLGGKRENGISVTIMSNASGAAWSGGGAAGTTTMAVNSPTMLTTTNTGTLTVSYFNTYVKTIEGKEIRFTHASNYDKVIKIIP
jgi:hypothetical protein